MIVSIHKIYSCNLQCKLCVYYLVSGCVWLSSWWETGGRLLKLKTSHYSRSSHLDPAAIIGSFWLVAFVYPFNLGICHPKNKDENFVINGYRFSFINWNSIISNIFQTWRNALLIVCTGSTCLFFERLLVTQNNAKSTLLFTVSLYSTVSG